jgi:hypothetical protein
LRRLAPVLVLAAIVAGCGQKSADLFSVTRDGSISGAHLVMSVTDDGHVSCNGGPLHEISSDELIRAREITRELTEPAGDHLVLRARPGSTLRYTVDIDGDKVRFADNALGQKPEMFEAALLVRQLAKGRCGLPR